LVRVPPLNVVPVGVKPPTPLPLLSVTIAVIVALPRLVTVIGTALSAIVAGGPALIAMLAESETPAPVAVAVSVTFPAVLPEV
jgi:hypothetical protein